MYTHTYRARARGRWTSRGATGCTPESAVAAAARPRTWTRSARLVRSNLRPEISPQGIQEGARGTSDQTGGAHASVLRGDARGDPGRAPDRGWTREVLARGVCRPLWRRRAGATVARAAATRWGNPGWQVRGVDGLSPDSQLWRWLM